MAIGLLLTFFIAYFSCSPGPTIATCFQLPIFHGIVSLMAFFVLHEKITPTRWAGVLFICPGVFAVGHTSPQTTEPQP